MQYLTEKLFRKKALLLALVSCTGLQILRAVINYIYEYSINGNYVYDSIGMVISIVAEFIGYVSVFSGYGIVIYLVFLYGLKGGGEWTLALIVEYGLVYFLTFYIGSLTFGVTAAAITAILLSSVYLIWTKGCRGVSGLIFASMLIPYLAALLILFSTTVLSTDALVYNFMYGLLNLGTDFLLIIIIARLANLIRTRAISSGDGSADISIGKKIFPKGSPLLKTMLFADIIYTSIGLVGTAIETHSLLSEYGAPINSSEWITLISPYVKLAVYFVIGYAVMLFIASKLEEAFISSEDEAAAIGKKRR